MTRSRRIAANFVIILCLYGNLVGLSRSFRFPNFPASTSPLPAPDLMRKLFDNFKVFDSFAPVNQGFTIRGVRGPGRDWSDNPSADMFEIAPVPYFPQRPSEAYVRMGRLGQEETRLPELHNETAAKIKRFYNRDHPNNPVDHVLIYFHQWPKSSESFRARMSEGTTKLVGQSS